MSQSVEIFRLLYRPWPYVLITMIKTLVAAGLILVLVVVLDKGIFGYFLGTLLASAFTATVSWYLVRDYLDFRKIQSDWWPRLLRFGAPLFPAGMAMYVMSASDRWFIQHYHGETMLGIYAVGAKFALIMALAIETFRKAWWPIAMDAMHSEDGPETYRAIARMFMGGGVAVVVYLSFISPWLVKFMAGPAFQDAWLIVGVLAWQSLFYGFYLIGSAGLWKAEKTRYSMYLIGGAAVLNIGLNWWLVPEYGSVGAAVATVLSHLCLVAVSMIASERLWRVNFETSVLIAQITVGATIVAWLSIRVERSCLTALGAHLVVLMLLVSMFNRQRWGELKRKFARNA
jgi:O-antigen/teichoic acid export membrane protein